MALMQGQVSNSNSLMDAQVAHQGTIANALQSGIDAQNKDGRAPKAPNTDVQDAAAIIGAGTALYNDYQRGQAAQSNTSGSSASTWNNPDDDPYAGYGTTPDYLNTPYPGN